MSSAEEKYEDQMLALISGELDAEEARALREAIAEQPQLVQKLEAWEAIDGASRQPMLAPDPRVGVALRKAAHRAVRPQHRQGFLAFLELLSATPSFASLGLVVITGSLVFVLLGEYDELDHGPMTHERLAVTEPGEAPHDPVAEDDVALERVDLDDNVALEPRLPMPQEGLVKAPAVIAAADMVSQSKSSPPIRKARKPQRVRAKKAKAKRAKTKQRVPAKEKQHVAETKTAPRSPKPELALQERIGSGAFAPSQSMPAPVPVVTRRSRPAAGQTHGFKEPEVA